MMKQTTRHPVLYEARYHTICGGVEYPVMDENGRSPSFRDVVAASNFAHQFAPLHCVGFVVSLRYAEASGCYERF